MTPRKSFRGPGSGWSPPTYTVADDLKVTGGYVPQGVNNSLWNVATGDL